VCELFGVCAKSEVTINPYLEEFYSHSDRHPHGWGLACLEGNEASIEKEPVQASTSAYLKARLSAPVRVRTALAHIRNASIGSIIYQNCHPYTKKDDRGRRWTLIHNGTIFCSPQIEALGLEHPGRTDSERVLWYLVGLVNEKERMTGQELGSRERFALLDEAICSLSASNKLNLIFYDGEQMYVHTNFAGTLHYLKTQEGVVFSTQPLDGGDWKPVPFLQLLAFQDGQLVFEGTKHSHEYIQTEEDLQTLRQIVPDRASIAHL
jgi:glutamine amidotransferase